MKAKGLQKLRWFCQMCQKQCRDENGFKCHRMSDGHQRQMELFGQNPHQFMDDFSKEFDEGFMKLMSTQYCRTRILANTVYMNFISEKLHLHMNATIWTTLSSYVQYLGRTGMCKIDKTPKGWYLEYIDPEVVRREEEEKARHKKEMTEEERRNEHLNKLVKAGVQA